MSNRITLALALTVAFAAPLSAQTGRRPADSTAVDVERARRLEGEASALTSDLRSFGKAARLLREAASLRPLADPMAIANLARAGRLQFYRKDLRGAYASLVEGAERAFRTGDVLNAAHAYLDAAIVAIERKDGPSALRDIERARLLSYSPYLSRVEHARLAARLGMPPAVLAGRN
jgi:hypothetical protein